MSSIIDYQDRSTCVLFGDGAGAVVVSAAGDGDGAILDFEHEIDGSGGAALCMPAGGSLRPPSHETVDQRLHYVKQDGATVFKFAVRKTEEIARRILERNGLTAGDIDLFVSHQANRRIIQSATEKLGVDAGQGHHQHRAVRQHDGGDHPAGAERRGLLGPAEEGRSRAARVGRRRLHGRRGAAALGVLRQTDGHRGTSRRRGRTRDWTAETAHAAALEHAADAAAAGSTTRSAFPAPASGSAGIRSSACVPWAGDRAHRADVRARSSCRRTTCGVPRVVQLRMLLNVAIDLGRSARCRSSATSPTCSGNRTRRTSRCSSGTPTRCRPATAGDWLFVAGVIARDCSPLPCVPLLVCRTGSLLLGSA